MNGETEMTSIAFTKFATHHAHIGVKLSTPYGIAGEKMVGKVFLNATAGCPPFRINVVLEGFQKTRHVNTGIDIGPNYNRFTTSGKRVIPFEKALKKEIVTDYITLAVGDDGIDAGKYNFPFTFEMPSDIPGTFVFRKDNIEAKIVYKLKIVLESLSNSSDITFGVIHKQKIFMQAAPVKDKYIKTALVLQDSRYMRSFCCLCFPSRVAIRGELEKDTYTIREEAKLKLFIDYNGYKNLRTVVRKIVVSLVQKLSINSTGDKTINPFNVICVEKFRSDRLDELSDKAKLKKDGIDLQLKLQDMRTMGNENPSLVELINEDYYYKLLQPTLENKKASNIVSRYFLHVEIKYNNMYKIWSENPLLIFPVTISSPKMSMNGSVITTSRSSS